MNNSFVFLLLLFLLSFELVAYEVISLHPETVVLTPGSLAILKAKVPACSCHPEKAFCELCLPDAFESLCGSTNEIVLDHEEQLLLFPIKVKTTAVPHTYTVSLKFYCGENRLECSLASVTVLRQKNLQACIPTKAPYVGLTEPYSIDFICRNKGNTPLKLIAKISGNPECYFREDVEPFILQPGEELTQPFVICSAVETDYCYHQVCKLQIFDVEDEALLFEESWLYEILPKGGRATLEKIYFPSWLTFFALRSAEAITAGVELYGSGELEPGSERYLEYVARLPSDLRNTILELDQQFTLHYWTPWLHTLLGDGYYSLSHLTEFGRYGRGGGYAVREGCFGCGAFYAVPPYHQTCPLKEGGGYLDWDLSPTVTAGLRYLCRAEGGLPKANLLSAEVYCNAWPAIQIDVECAKDLSRTHHNHGLWGSAYGEFYTNNFGYIEGDYTEANFLGYFSNQRFLAAGLNLNLDLNTRLLISSNYLKQLPKQCCDAKNFGTEPLQKQFNIQLSRNLTNRLSATATFLQLRGEDLSIFHEYNFNQLWTGLIFSYNHPDFNTTFTSSWGKEHDLKRRKYSSFIQRYDLYAEWYYSKCLSFNAHVDVGNLDYYDARPWRYTVGAGFRYCGSDNLSVYGRVDLADNIPDHSRFYHGELRADYQRPNGHVVSAQGRAYIFSGKTYPNEEIILLSYSIPFGTEIGTNRRHGAVQGSLWHPEYNLPIENAIVSVNGDKRLTDERGHFAVSGLAQGYHPFTIEYLPGSLIPHQTTPEEVFVSGGGRTALELFAQNKATIKGKVLLKELCLGWQSVSAKWHGWENARLYLSSVDCRTVLSTLSDSEGNFYFQGIQPGSWTLKIQVELGSYASSHQLCCDELHLDLEPDTEVPCTFHLVPRRNELQPIRR